MKFFRTIRFRLTAWYALMVLVLLGGVLLFVFLRLHHNAGRQADRSLKAEAKEAANLVNRQDGFNMLELEIQSEEGVEGGKLMFFAVYDWNGKLLMHTANFQPPEELPEADRPSSPDAQPRFEWCKVREKYRARLVTAPVTNSASGEHYILRIARSIEREEKVIENLTENLFYFVPAILGLAVAGGLFLARAGLKPMERLSRQAATMSENELNRRLPVRGVNDEIDRHAVALNSLLERLERAFSEVQKFAARASHELRTPLTSLRLEIERALSRTKDSETVAHLESAVTEAERLASLVDKLLFLTRMQSEGRHIERNRVDLTSTLTEIVTDLEAIAAQKQIGVQDDLQPGCIILGEETLIRQMLWNVFDNAVKYSPAGGTVKVILSKRDSDAVLEVSDQGPGMSEETRRRAFEPFYRETHAGLEVTGGFGLGLNIAKWVCENHSGDIEIHTIEGGGTTITIRLPLA